MPSKGNSRKSEYSDKFSELSSLMRCRFYKPRNISPSNWNSYVLCATHKATRWIQSGMNIYSDEIVADVAAFLTNQSYNKIIFNLDYVDEDIIEEMEDVMNNKNTNNTNSFVKNTSSSYNTNHYDSDESDNDSDSESDSCDSEDDY